MAKQKKSARRVPRSATPRAFGDSQPVPAAPADTAEALAPHTNGTVVRPGAATFRRRAASSESRPQLPLWQEYGYVAKDLARLAMLAGAMVVLMIVLGLILH